MKTHSARRGVLNVMAGGIAAWQMIAAASGAKGEVKAPETELQKVVLETPSAARLREWHTLLGSEPHIAGTEGDARQIERIRKAFTEMGLEVEVHEILAYLPMPVEAKVEVLEPVTKVSGSGQTGGAGNDEGKFTDEHGSADGEGEGRKGLGKYFSRVIPLSVEERALKEDPDAASPEMTIGWNAYSGNGDVTGEVVYANFGRKEDFEKLKNLGVEVKGKIVLARYGGNFRGYKAKYAQLAGAAGLLIYGDPKDCGYMKGLTYPEGGWGNESYIQRGSILWVDTPGDPLTPGWAALKSARHVSEEEVDLPKIPVQPIGYGATEEIVKRMKGRAIPAEDSKMIGEWQGGLPYTYRLEGGSDLQVHLMVKQERKERKTASVIGTLKGESFPDQRVIIGCHHDAWCDGASDPLSGSILVMEAARSFAEAKKAGHGPKRTVQFALWGAEEFGIIGSTEYCENYESDIGREGVAYINLDAATMGTTFSASASPTLWRVIEEATEMVPQAKGAAGQSVHEAWLGEKKEAEFGEMGGGSDHIGFYCHIGIPSCGLNAGGAAGTAYHSNYDDLIWYRKVVGEDYEPALMLARMTNVLTARLADDAVMPIEPMGYVKDLRKQVDAIEKRAKELKVEVNLEGIRRRVDSLEKACAKFAKALGEGERGAGFDGEQTRKANAMLGYLERLWMKDYGLPEREWFKNWYGSNDPESGYAAWGLPALRWAVERGDKVRAMTAEYEGMLDNIYESIEEAAEKIGG